MKTKKVRSIYIPHPKIRGEWVELRFMTRAIELRFRVCRPWGDCAPYDVVTEFRRPLPPRPDQMHHLQALGELLPLPPRLQRPTLLPPRHRLHCGVCNSHRQ